MLSEVEGDDTPKLVLERSAMLDEPMKDPMEELNTPATGAMAAFKDQDSSRSLAKARYISPGMDV